MPGENGLGAGRSLGFHDVFDFSIVIFIFQRSTVCTGAYFLYFTGALFILFFNVRPFVLVL